MKIQIHIAGTKRSGKTTIAVAVQSALIAKGLSVVMFDIDTVRRKLFGQEDIDAPIGSPQNQRMHREAHEHLFSVLIPETLKEGKTPIVVATHSRRIFYERAETVSVEHGATLKFILLETPDLQETVRRAKSDGKSLSDTNDLEKNPEQMKAYLASTELFLESYRGRDGNYLWIPQATQEEMTARAMRYILG